MKPKLVVKGTKELLRELAKFGQEAEDRVKSLTFQTAQSVALEARQNAARVATSGNDHVKIKDSINVEPNVPGEFKYSINVNAVPIAAYVEFGTGAFVDVPPEWKDMAWAFYVNGKGWMQPQPYLYPAYRRGKENYEKDLKALLERLTKKYSR